jgi:hypothetical protein
MLESGKVYMRALVTNGSQGVAKDLIATLRKSGRNVLLWVSSEQSLERRPWARLPKVDSAKAQCEAFQ